MPENPPAGTPRCCPCLFYDDMAGAIAFLERAFAFEKRFSHAMADGTIGHAQLVYQDALVMLSPTHSPGALRPVKSAGSGPLHAAIYLFVDDVDAHCVRARKAGATILLEPTDMFWGDRIYCANDSEGQFWTFAKHVRDVKFG